ncbi:MAG: SPW repeat protein [Bacillota bacterium]|nr:SPW repeat protein [Bacillota bacterium]
MQRWQDWAGVILGVWMFLSPWILGFSAEAGIMWNAVIVGILAAALALWHGYGGPAWTAWVNVVVGVWLILSPWILAYSTLTNPMANAVVVGLLLGGSALWATQEKAERGKG